MASTLYVRLKSKTGTNWVNSDYTYTATSVSGPAQITSPTPGSTLTSSTTTFTWNTGTGVSQYWLYVGTTQGGNQFYDQDRGNESIGNRSGSADQRKHDLRQTLVEDRGELAVRRLHLQSEADAVGTLDSRARARPQDDADSHTDAPSACPACAVLTREFRFFPRTSAPGS